MPRVWLLARSTGLSVGLIASLVGSLHDGSIAGLVIGPSC